MTQEEYIKERIEDQIKWYGDKSQWNQKWYKRLQIFAIGAASFIPFLTGFTSDSRPSLNIIIGVLGIGVTIISGSMALYKFQENWIEYRTTSESLKHEKYLFLTKSEPYSKENDFLLLVERVETLISKENTDWAKYIRIPEKKDEAKKTS